MAKLKFVEWLGIVFLVSALIMIGFIVIITKFNIHAVTAFTLSLFLVMYISSYLLWYHFFELGEKFLKDDIELLRLEKEDAALIWIFVMGIGIASIIPGLINEKTSFLIFGLVFLTIGNIIYNIYYLPRQSYLIRKRKIKMKKNEKRRKIF